MITDLEYLLIGREEKEKYFVQQNFVEQDSLYEPPSYEIVYKTDSLLESNRTTLIIGGPGTGKTETLHHLAYTASKGNLKSEFFSTILIEAHTLSNNSNLVEEIKSHLKNIPREKRNKKNIPHEKSKKKKWPPYKLPLILIDGLDALSPNNRENIIHQLIYLQMDLRLTPFVVTTRPYGSDLNALKSYYNFLSIQNFTDEQIDQFLSRSFSDFERLKEKVYSFRATSSLIGNPFILKIISQNLDVISSERLLIDPTIFMEKLVNQSLLSISVDWDIDYDLLQRFFENLAAQMHIHQMNDCHISLLANIAEQFLVEINTIMDIGLTSSILNRTPDENIYRFGHRTLLEHFLTKYIRRSAFEGIKQNIFSKNDDVLIGIEFQTSENKSLENFDELIKTIPYIFPEFSKQVIPVYARSGSLLIALAFFGGAILVYALRKYVDAILTELGKKTAEKLTNHKKEIQLPAEIKSFLPEWIENDPGALKIFTEEIIRDHAKKTREMLTDTALTKIWIKSKMMENFGNQIEERPVEEIINID
jgi:hypothetical protein